MLNLKNRVMLLVATLAIALTACNKTDTAQTTATETQQEQHVASDAEHSTHEQGLHEAEQSAEQQPGQSIEQSAQIAAIDQPSTN